MDIQKCLEKGYLVKEESSKDLIEKELKESNYDFEKARLAFKNNDYKWCIVKCYYSMFHSAKAVCFKLGFREKSHFVLLIVLEDLNKKGKLEVKYVNDFSAAMESRESADYRYEYSKERADNMLKATQEFNQKMKILLKK